MASLLSVPTVWPTNFRRQNERYSALDVFHAQLQELLPRLRAWSFAMTRNRADAEDLVHDATVNALAAWSTFEPGSNFKGWMYRILRNQFTSNRTDWRATQQLEGVSDDSLTRPATQDNGLLLQTIWRGFAQLIPEQRQAMMLVVVQELSYEEAADLAGCPVGTMKSRVSRARRILAAWLHGQISCHR